MARQLKQMGKDVFLSLSDELKLEMHRRQFEVDSEDSDEIDDWFVENMSEPYYIEFNNDLNYVMLYNDEDAVAFKLRWL